jgi:protein SCO1/2
MADRMRVIHWMVWGLLAMVVLSIAFLFLLTVRARARPPLPTLGEVPDFRLTNQVGQAISLADLKGHTWVADIVFTRCPGPCLQMTRKMAALQAALPRNSSVKLVSLTADPQFDMPAVLQTYGERFKADPSRWEFLTGPKADVYQLATRGLKLALQENPETTAIEEQFVHSTRFVLIDGRGQIRAVSFDGTDPQVVAQVLSAIKRLQREPNG